MSMVRIPLFPLNLVLFPCQPLPLYIFEPRYKLMIRQSIEQHSPFGIVRAGERELATVGCTAAVSRVLRTYSDGRMEIITVGENAYRISDLHTGNPCLEATVEFLPDNPDPGSPAMTKELLTVFTDCHLLLHGTPPADLESTTENLSAPSLAYRLARDLPLETEVLQDLLETRIEHERRRKLVERLNHLLPQLLQIAQMRSKAARNGHGPN